ncbi:MAG TPA: ABC transporter substrate-binding protein [Candidatus Dormibacteraeota bacterium]
MNGRNLALVVAGLLLAVACGGNNSTGTSTGGGKHGGTLNVAIGIDPDTLDPAAQTTTTASQIVDMMVERLYTMDSSGNTVPQLASGDPQVSSDGLTYTIPLRTGVKFSDGTAFNAAAAKQSIDRLLDPNTFKTQPGVLSVIASTSAQDDSHLVVKLKSPFAPFVAALTQTNAAILSPVSLTQQGNTAQKVVVPVGTGTYVFKERVAGDHITLSANTNYWGTKPNYDTQVIKIVPDDPSREALIRSGGADVIISPPLSDLPALSKDSTVKVLAAKADRTIFISIDTVDQNVALLQKPEVRQALNYAVDKKTIIQNVMFGQAVELDAPMSKTLFGYCSVGTYNYDVNKAKSMLQAAGASGMTVKLGSPTGRYPQDIKVAQAVAGYLRDAGLNVQGPMTSDWPTYLGSVNVPPAQAKYDMHLLGWAPAYLDASQQFEQFRSDRIPPKGLETSYYSNQQVTDLVVKAGSETDQNQRKTDYCSASKIVWNDAPWIFLYNQSFPIVYSSKVTGVGSFPNEKFDTRYASPA